MSLHHIMTGEVKVEGLIQTNHVTPHTSRVKFGPSIVFDLTLLKKETSTSIISKTMFCQLDHSASKALLLAHINLINRIDAAARPGSTEAI